MNYTAADELRDLHQSILACRTLDDLRSVQITIQRINEAASDALSALSVEQEPVAWVEQQFGARVATILENPTSVVEIQDMRDGRYSLIVHWNNSETGRGIDLSAEMSASDLAKIGALFPSKAKSFVISPQGRIAELEKALPADDDLAWIMDGDLAPTAGEIADAANRWCGDKDRETFASDVYYFRENWRALNGLKEYVAREVAKRCRLADSRRAALRKGATA